jgi:hypothetical protein
MGPCVNGVVHLALIAEREFMTLSRTRHDMSKWDRMNGIVLLTLELNVGARYFREHFPI